MPHVEGVEHRFVDVNGLRMHVAEAGEGEPLVMLHGWPQHWYEWRHLIGPLAEPQRVICPDLRGLGWTDAPPRGYEKENLADDVLALLDELGVERFDLIGHDWGGWAGYLICFREPERVKRYMALNIFPPFLPPDANNLLNVWRFWYQVVIASPVARTPRRAAARRPQPGRSTGSASTRGCHAERDAFLSRLADPARAEASVQYYRSFQLRELPAIAAGRYRNKWPETADAAPPRHRRQGPARLAPSRAASARPTTSPTSCFPGVGHFIADEIPDVVATGRAASSAL